MSNITSDFASSFFKVWHQLDWTEDLQDKDVNAAETPRLLLTHTPLTWPEHTTWSYPHDLPLIPQQGALEPLSVVEAAVQTTIT